MTVDEVISNFKFFLDQLDTGTVPSMDNPRIYLAINNAIETFINTRYDPIKELLYRNKGFEEVQKRIEDLTLLVETKDIDVVDDSLDNRIKSADTSTLNPSYQYFLKGSVKIGDVYKGAHAVRQDSVNVLFRNNLAIRTARVPKIYFEGKSIKIIKPTAQGATPIGDKLRITYLRRFNEFSATQTIDLSDHTHRLVVQIAVNQTLEALESRRTTSQKNVELDMS